MDDLHFVETEAGIVLGPRSFWAADPSQYNGCGPDGAGALVPDNILGLDVSDLCNIHDHMSGRCANRIDEVITDAVLAANLVVRVVTCSNGFMVWPRMALATKYILAVASTTFSQRYWAANRAECPNGRYLKNNEWFRN